MAPTFLTARQELERLLQSNIPLPNGVREALEAYRAAGKDPIIQNLQSQIDFASDPFIRLNLLTAAQLTEEICELDPLVKSAEAALDGQSRRSTPESRDKEIARLLRCLSELRRIAHDLRPSR